MDNNSKKYESRIHIESITPPKISENDVNEKNYFGQFIKKARLKNNYSARQLAKLCNISHTELINIEKGLRVKPSIVALKGFEKYLKLDFVELAVLAGYSEDSAKIGNEELNISYDKFDKMLKEFEDERKDILNFINDQRKFVLNLINIYEVLYNEIKKNEIVFSDEALESAQEVYLGMTYLSVLEYRPNFEIEHLKKQAEKNKKNSKKTSTKKSKKNT